MRDDLIVVKPFHFINYIEIKGHQCMGEHGVFKISGYVPLEKEQEYLNLIMSKTWVHADAVTYDGTAKHIFKGIIFDADMEKVNETCVLTLTLITGSFLMDTTKHTRSFQDDGISYAFMMDIITKEYDNSQFEMMTGNRDKIPGFIFQYKETDWEFARRLASHFKTDIFPDSTFEGIKISFGEPVFYIRAEINTNEYSVIKRNGECSSYVVKWRELFHVGDWLYFNGIPVLIVEANTELVGNELYHSYRMVQKNGVKVEKKYNRICAGTSFTGTVLAVEKDKVQIEIEKDENKSRAGRKWFMYATPYSSPDGTGWYCMPEIGDRIRLRIPSEDENEAYVISSVHLESAAPSERKNPDYKSIMNKQGKEILLTPKSLVLTNNEGMSIEILDDEGIRITSNKNIVFHAADSIEITSTSSKLELYAKENISLKQGNTQMNMDGEMRFYGARLNLN